MKFYFLVLISVFIFSCSCSSQSETKGSPDFVYFQQNVKEYKIDDCLSDLLKTVAGLDTNQLSFPANKFYYDLTFENRSNYRFMSVTPSRWEKSSTLDFKGIIKIGNMSFLCRGDFQKDPLFTETGNDIRVQIRKPKAYQYDSIDVKIEAFAWKPTLAGKYTFCKGVPIDLYILVGKKIEGYSTKNNQ